ncbi:unnamed protein product [Heterobilharzia americana]|nr:unnamed protein product [Heterobilharzia americana]
MKRLILKDITCSDRPQNRHFIADITTSIRIDKRCKLPNHINPTDSSCQPKLHTNDKIGSIHSLPIIENVNCGSDETKVETAGMTVVDGSAESPPTVSSVNTDKSLSSSRTPVKPLCKSSSMMNSKTHSTHVVHCPYFPVSRGSSDKCLKVPTQTGVTAVL